MANKKSKTGAFMVTDSQGVKPKTISKDFKTTTLTLEDFSGEYRDVVKELLAMKRRKAQESGKSPNLIMNKVVEQAVMRVVDVGQKQHLSPSKVKQMVVSSSTAASRTPQWQPQKALERRAGMLAGSTRLIKIG